MFEKFNNLTFWIYGLIVTFAVYITKRLFEMQTYNAVNTSQHKDFKEAIAEIKKDFKEDLSEVKEKLNLLVEREINKK